MRTILLLLEKEFRQIFRNKALVGSIVVSPIIQLLLLPLAANYEVKNVLISIVDHDHSSYSRELATTIGSSGYFSIVENDGSYDNAALLVEQDKADLVLEIPSGFERTLIRENEDKVFIAVNAINGVKAGLGSAYLGAVIKQFNGSVRLQWIQQPRYNPIPVIEVTSSNWFNPLMNYFHFIVPGLLVMLVTGGGLFLTTINIVREKEIGTIEQINVTPIKKSHFILGKLIPFWVLQMCGFTVGLLIAMLFYNVIPVGHIWLLYLFLGVYLIAILGSGLLISTYSHTQQEAMFMGFFFMMIANLMSGLYTPINSMPEWAKIITMANPVSYFIDVMRMVVLKGSSLGDIKYHILKIGVIALVVNTWAVLNYKKTS